MNRVSVSPADRATPQDTKNALLQKAKRKVQAAPIRVTFVQQGRGKATKPGPLATLVKHHDELALDLFLFAHAMASHEPYAIHQPAAVLARALARTDNAPVGTPTISKAWARLEGLQLIQRGRSATWPRSDCCGEDGTGRRTLPRCERPPREILQGALSVLVRWLECAVVATGQALLLLSLTMKDDFLSHRARFEVLRTLGGYDPSRPRGVEDVRSPALYQRI